jgi:integrase
MGIITEHLGEVMKRKLTDRFVERLKPESGVIRVWDAEVKGFGVRVSPAGYKSYIFQFTREASKVQATIGSAESWSCEDARDKARELRQLHESGNDARATLQDVRTKRDFEDLVQCWREDYKPKIRPHSQACFESLLKRILPELGKRLVKDLALADVEDLHRKIAKEGLEVTANRAITFLRRLLSIAEKKGWRAMGSNQVTHFERPSEESRTRVLSAEELKALGVVLRAFPDKRRDPDPILFLALSGLRKSEALGLRWADVDLERGTMTFSVHKTSKKAGVKVLPIDSHLRDILKARAALRLSPYVFAGYFKRVVKKSEDGTTSEKQTPTDGPLTSIKWTWGQAAEESGLGSMVKVGRKKVFKPDAVIHDLRRTFNTVCAELGYPPQVFDFLLGHKSAGMAGVYTHLNPAGGLLAEASQATADWIAAAMGGRSPALGQKVKLREEDGRPEQQKAHA